jgi:sulfur-oxidizing protein SoxY
MTARRRFISIMTGLATLSLVRPVRAQPDPSAEVLRKLTGGKPVTSGRVAIDTPRLADNGHSVPFRVAVESPMTSADHVRSITLISARNPRPLMATFRLGPKSGRAEVVTRVRLNGTQRVLAVAQLSDGSFWSGSAEVEVTESACLDMS